MKTINRAQAARLLALAPDEPVRLHTFQDHGALETATRRGYLAGEQGHSQFPAPYAWMLEQMRERIPGFSGDLPVWAWLTRPDGRRKRLDESDDLVRITAIVPRGRILISDFDMWHAVLNEHAIALDQWQQDAIDARWPEAPREPRDQERYLAEARATWTHIFDPLAPVDSSWWGSRDRLWLQACVDRIMLNEIVSVRRYGDTTRPLRRVDRRTLNRS